MRCDEALLFEYLNGELSSEEAERTGEHLDNCLNCRERFRIMTALDSHREVETVSRKKVSLLPGRLLRLAAALLLLALLAPVIYKLLPADGFQENPGDLASAKPYPLILLDTRSSSGSDLSRGLMLYHEGSYREAADELEKLPDDSTAIFFSGVCLYLLDEPARALEKLTRAKRISEKWASPADWYRAQCLLKLNKTDEARIVLQQIAGDENPYRRDAEELLRKIERK